MEIKIEELQVGDEVLICCQTTFKRLRIKVAPSKNKDGHWKKVKCDIRNENVGNTNGYWAAYNFKNTDYNDVFNADLTYRDMWLINRKMI